MEYDSQEKGHRDQSILQHILVQHFIVGTEYVSNMYMIMYAGNSV